MNFVKEAIDYLKRHASDISSPTAFLLVCSQNGARKEGFAFSPVLGVSLLRLGQAL